VSERQLIAGAELAAAAALVAWNTVINRAVPSPAYVPVNLAAAGLSLASARSRRVPAADLGLGRDRVGRGLRVGRATAGGAGHALYHTLVRIPLGTAVAEEAIFRGALLGLLLQRHSQVRASVVSSALFGLCHVLPTLDTLAGSPAGPAVGGDPVRTGGAVLASVLVTAAAGLGFSWLRFRGDSVVTPAVVHAALNSSAFVAARLAARSAGR
jgi:membrane protease YdiL (CAAX protease family)